MLNWEVIMNSILIVDDENKIRDVYKQMFVKHGYDVRVASNAVEARELLRKEKINLILLDINMREVNGVELYEVIQSFHTDAKVIVSSVHSIEDQKDMIPSAQDYFDKSEGLRALVNKVRNVLPAKEKDSKESNILVIDDDQKVRLLLHDLLTNAGYNPVEVADNQNVLDFIKKKSQKIDLIILDLAMPKISGIDFFDVIKSSYPNIKVLISSNYPTDDQKVMIFDADDYYDKSDGNNILLEKINTLIGKSEK